MNLAALTQPVKIFMDNQGFRKALVFSSELEAFLIKNSLLAHLVIPFPGYAHVVMHIQIVNFNLNGITRDQYEQVCETQFAPAFASVPGLLSKVWLSDPETNTYGGVYTWQDREAMQEYFQSELFQGVVSHPNLANITTRDFAILEQPTRATRGMV